MRQDRLTQPITFDFKGKYFVLLSAAIGVLCFGRVFFMKTELDLALAIEDGQQVQVAAQIRVADDQDLLNLTETIEEPQHVEAAQGLNQQEVHEVSPPPPPQQSRTRTRAVIHMGIHKTGTTSIQAQSYEKRDLLKLDGYEMPWYAYLERKRREGHEIELKVPYMNQRNFATCFLSSDAARKDRSSFPCDPDLLLSGTDIAQRNRNLFVTCESFVFIDPEGLDALASYLSRWDEVTIVIYYRRFYSWIASC